MFQLNIKSDYILKWTEFLEFHSTTLYSVKQLPTAKYSKHFNIPLSTSRSEAQVRINKRP